MKYNEVYNRVLEICEENNALSMNAEPHRRLLAHEIAHELGEELQ